MFQAATLDPEFFYQQRDHRTNLAVDQSDTPVHLTLTIAPAWAETVEGQLAFYWLASLVARMGRRYNHFRVWLPPAVALMPCLIPGNSAANLADPVMTHLQGADPFGSYALIDRPSDGMFVLAVGDLHGSIPGMIVRPSGWSSALTASGMLPHISPKTSDANPIGAALAAALGAAAIYHHFNRDKLSGRDVQIPLWVSAWHSAATQSSEEAAWWQGEPPLPNVIDIGRCLVVGAGALGGNALTILGTLKGLCGHIDIVDPDIIDITNLNRLVAALLSHFRKHKALVAVSSLTYSELQATPYLNRYERLQEAGGIRRLPIETYNLVLTGVDQMATRAFVQSDWPRYIVNAGTRGYSWLVSTHPVNSEGACVG
jgi:hypothetical protein